MNDDSKLTPGKMRAQLFGAEEAARAVLQAFFRDHAPADRVLTDFFRSNRKFGSRDRRMISAAVFALLRYWGWARKLMGAEFSSGIETLELTLTRREMLSLLFFALHVDGYDRDYLRDFAIELGLRGLSLGGSQSRRAAAFAAAIGEKVDFLASDLVPERILDLLPDGFSVKEFLGTMTSRPPMWIRVRDEFRDRTMARLAELGIEPETDFPVQGAVRIPAGSPALYTTEEFRSGMFEIQDLASQCIGMACSPRRGERWLDACAGAGGKTLQLAEMMEGRGTVVASDIRESALEELRTRVRRAGYGNVMTKPAGRQLVRHPYDGVLVDAPCTGSGVWRRNPGRQWLLPDEEPASCAARQLSILSGFAPAVKIGGRLVYATCSVFKAENEDVVTKFLTDNPQFELDCFTNPLDGVDTGGMARFMGHGFDNDYMFAARMKRVF
ncbi:MAG: RsmB/NOP family class I SAM-dependent RNA methyltransferase [Victivallaceae bacterium]|nr:RsmB/NOP family class I SAM-dependent RNA methyltransferase [Victivallaceae bacterium]